MARDSILRCCGKKGYTLYDEWVANPATKLIGENSYDTLNWLWIPKSDLGYEYMTLKPFPRHMRRYHVSLWLGSIR